MSQRCGRFSVNTVVTTLLVAVAVLFSMGFVPRVAFANPNQPIVVSMGDSYASCEGLEPYYGQDSEDKYHNQDWVAHRSSYSWESLLVIDGTTLGNVRAVPSSDAVIVESTDADTLTTYTYSYNNWSEGSWYYVAATAAYTGNVYGEGNLGGYQKREIQVSNSDVYTEAMYEARLAPQIQAIDYINNKYGKGSVDYITVQVGVNNMGIAQAVYSAASNPGLIGAEELRTTIETAKSTYYSSTYYTYKKMIQTLQNRAGSQAHIILVGYPTLFDGAVFSFQNIYFNTTEMQLVDDYMRWLDGEMEKLVDELTRSGIKNLHYVSLINAFAGHGAYSSDTYMYPIEMPAREEDVNKTGTYANISLRSIHCNEKGILATAAEVQKVINKIEEAKAAGQDYVTGWVVENGVTHYYNENGELCRNMWIGIGDSYGYLGADGALLTNTWKKIDGVYYYFGADGKYLRNTWVSYKGSYYYLGDNGTVLTSSWVRYNDKYYYVGANGKAQANTWVKYNGSYYYLNSKGNPTVNAWVKYNGSYYYMGSNGKPVVNGWVRYNGNYYYMGSNGKPVVNAWISYGGSQYYFNGNGVCIKKK